MRAFLLAFLILAAGKSASAQTVLLTGTPDDSAAVLLSEIIDRGEYELIDRDTVLDDSSVISTDLIIVDARVTLEGVVQGSVAVIEGDFFIRPGAVVGGNIAVLGGGAYPSGLAEVNEVIYLHPRVQRELTFDTAGHTISLTEPPGPGVIRFGSLFGIGVPTYDRVDGLSLSWSGTVASAGDTSRVSLTGTAAYRMERGRLGGGLELRVRPSKQSILSIGARRVTETSDRWIRDDLSNSLAALFVRSDIRDYFESDELSATFARTPPPPIIQGEGFITPYLTLRASRDRSLKEGDPWSLFGGEEWRLNPPIDEGVLASAILGAALGWQGVTSSFGGNVALEWAPGTLGDFGFAQARATAGWDMVALYQHQIAVSGHVRLPIGGSEAPLQRWSFVGGPQTLPAHPAAAFRGDHLLLVESVYLAPIPRVQLPLVGVPSLRLLHAAGMAWRTGDAMPPLEQNLGVGLKLMIFEAMVYVDPADSSLDPTFSFGAQLPLSSGISF